MRKPRVKAGTNDRAAADRRLAFARAYIANGRNATQAAITAGFSPRTAKQQGSRLLTNVDVRDLVDKVAAPAIAEAGLTVERALKQLERVTFCDQRKLFGPDGKPKLIHDLDEATAAAVSGVGPNGFETHDALKALDMTMRHLGLYERDNAQRGESLALQVVVVGPE